MDNKDRICFICGKEYRWCPNCREYDSNETYKYLFHDEKCAEISKIWYAYRGDEISKEEAKRRMSKIKPNIDDALLYTSVAANEIKEIFKVEEKLQEPKVVNKVEERPVEKPVEVAVEEKPAPKKSETRSRKK